MRLLFAAIAVLALAAAGCRTARMRVDPRVAAASDAYVVAGANPRVSSAPMAFGPWRTRPAVEEPIRNWSRPVLDVYEVSESYRPYALRVEGPGGALDAECHERRRAPNTRDVIGVEERAADGKPALACAFRPVGAPAGSAWTLAVLSRDDGRFIRFTGELRDPRGAAAYAVRSSHAMEGTAHESTRPVGWTLESAGGPAGAIETIGSRRVFLPRGVSEAPVLAAASAALLLFEPDPGLR